MTDAWLKTIEATFERDFGLQGVRAELDKVLWVRVLRQR